MASNVGVHLVGSIPLSSADEVFTRVQEALPNRLFSVPDGETGIRGNFIRWQIFCFPKEVLRPHVGGIDLPDDHPGVFTLESIKPTKYDEVAIESYARFVELRNQNIIPQGVRFQVSLPTAFAAIQTTRHEFHARIEPLYEQRILKDLETIIREIPARDLAIQWDMVFEIVALECEKRGVKNDNFKPYFTPIKQGVLDRMQRLCADIPDEIPVGFHLCYGDRDHKHYIDPDTMGTMVDLANDILKHIKRPVSWFHMPVPIDRDDAAYLSPLRELQAGEDTRLYLGLVHASDMEGTLRRIKAAQAVTQRKFGVSTECGMGRIGRDELESILEIMAAVTRVDGHVGSLEAAAK